MAFSVATRPPEPSTSPLILLALLVVVLVSGCTYSFSGSSLPAHIKTVAVPTFTNETLQPALERQLTDAVTAAFQLDSRLALGGSGTADALVMGRVLDYDRSVFGVSESAAAEQYRVTIRLAVVVKDRVKGKDIWTADNLLVQSSYNLNGQSGDRTTEEEAREDAAEKLATDIVNRTLEDW